MFWFYCVFLVLFKGDDGWCLRDIYLDLIKDIER